MEERSTTACPKCRCGNPPENRFCGACGASLTTGGELTRRTQHSLTVANRVLLPAQLKPVGKALAVGLATLAAQAGLAYLRRRVEGSGHTSLPATTGTGATAPERLVYESFEELHTWLREGDLESRTFTQRTARSFRTTNPTDGQR